MNYSSETGGCGGCCIVELIRARAYQLYQARQCEPNYALDDWLRAEREVQQQLGFDTIKERERASSFWIMTL